MAKVTVPSSRSGDTLSKPLLGSPRTNLHVPVFSPFGGKEVVQTEASQTDCNACLSGIFSGGRGGGDESNREIALVIRSSVWINFLLFLAKLYAFLISHSLAVLASLVDSGIDLLGQGALMWTNHLAQVPGEEYPVGRTRLEPVGVMICAVVMGMASIEVISTSIQKLVGYWDSEPPPLDFRWDTVTIIVGIIVLKFFLYQWCAAVAKRNPRSDAVEAIAQDNQNDVLSNMVALVAGEMSSALFLEKFGRGFWMVDPFAGVLISVYIIYTWLMTGREQVEMIVGKKADPEFLKRIQELAQGYSARVQLDEMKAYHFGPKYLVELEVVMPEDTPLRESHDVGLELQHEIEKMEVERCFVHIDYQMREHDDHDPGVPLSEKLYGAKNRETPRANAKIGLLTAEGLPFAKENSQDSRRGEA